MGREEKDGRAVGNSAGFPLNGISGPDKTAALISPFKSGQDYCCWEHQAACRLLSHSGEPGGQLSPDDSCLGRGKPVPGGMGKVE